METETLGISCWWWKRTFMR